MFELIAAVAGFLVIRELLADFSNVESGSSSTAPVVTDFSNVNTGTSIAPLDTEFSNVESGSSSVPVQTTVDYDEWIYGYSPGIDFAQANINAFAQMIATAEGTSNARGYQTIAGYAFFDDFTDHPRFVNPASNPPSDAAGKYQILSKTWDTVVQPRARLMYGAPLPDFSPESQEQAFALLLHYRRAYDDVINGRFESALSKVALEWASLPGSPYGQPKISLARARDLYLDYGGNIA